MAYGNAGHYSKGPQLTVHHARASQARDFQEEVAKLIDVTTCIGCKACQVACSEWNDIRDDRAAITLGCTTTPMI